MKCTKCDGKGYLESFYHYGDRARPMIRQCCDITAYSRRVQLLAQTPEEAFKSAGRKDPFIGRGMTVTFKGVELKQGTLEPISGGKRQGEPCAVLPLRRR